MSQRLFYYHFIIVYVGLGKAYLEMALVAQRLVKLSAFTVEHRVLHISLNIDSN